MQRGKQISFTRRTDLFFFVKSDPVDILGPHLSNYSEVEMRSSPFTQYTRSQALY